MEMRGELERVRKRQPGLTVDLPLLSFVCDIQEEEGRTLSILELSQSMLRLIFSGGAILTPLFRKIW